MLYGLAMEILRGAAEHTEVDLFRCCGGLLNCRTCSIGVRRARPLSVTPKAFTVSAWRE